MLQKPFSSFLSCVRHSVAVARHFVVLSFFFLPLSYSSAGKQEFYRITPFDESDGMMVLDIFHGIQDEEGLIWFASRDGLLRYDGHRFRTFKAYAGDTCPLETNHISYIEDHGDRLLCLSQEKVYAFSKKTGTFATTDEKLAKRTSEIEYGSWIARIKNLPEYRGVGKLKVRMVDKQGGVWVRSNRGFERIEYLTRKVAPQKAGAEPEEVVRAIMSDRNGRIWIADMNGYLRLRSGSGSGVAYLLSDGSLSQQRKPFGRKAYTLFEDSKGRVWVGCKPGGLTMLRPEGNRYSAVSWHADGKPYSLSGDGIYAIAEDKRGRIWVATYSGGVNMLDERADGTVRFVNMKNLLRRYPADAGFVHGMCIARGDILILATTKGLYTSKITQDVSRMTFCRNSRRLGDPSSLPTDYANDVLQTRDGRIFVATNGGGLCVTDAYGDRLLSDTIRFRTFNSAGSTTTDTFYSLAEDGYGNVWFAGINTLAVVANGGCSVTNYAKSRFDGTFMFSQARPLCLVDGRMIFGTTQGALEFTTDNIRRSSYVPHIAFHCPDTVVLSPDSKSLFVEFSALDFSHHEPITYAYMMEGLDTGWHYTKDNHVYYSNLPGGQFTLRVRSTNGDGVWTENENSVTVVRHPAFSETRTAWMLCGVALMFVLWIVWRTADYIRMLKRESGAYRLKTSEQLQLMAARIKDLVSNHSDVVGVKQEEMAAEDDNARFVERAKQFAKAHVADSAVTVETFADSMNMSSSKLYILCRKHLGYSPMNFLNHVKMNYAARLLQNAGDSPNISDIAYKCGFADPKYFSRCFKKIKGMSPTDYAAKAKEA